jgi:hypothetical protein
MGIPAHPGFNIHGPTSGGIASDSADRVLAHLKCYTTFLPAEIVGSATAKTFDDNDLNTLWGYSASGDVSWTLPDGLNPPLVWGPGVNDYAEGAQPIIISQHGSGKVTLIVGSGLSVVKPADLTELRTNGPGTGLSILYWPLSRHLIEVRAF